MKIGLINTKGALPGQEDYGYLPTHLLDSTGKIDGKSASQELDGLIIPGGSLIESESVTPELASEILNMADDGKFILGICSGFQLLTKTIDLGRNSPKPIIKEGLGIFDLNFSPMVNTNWGESEIINESFLTKGLVGEKFQGYHCHTYGHFEGNETPVAKSKLNRVNYKDKNLEKIDTVTNKKGNVVGTMIHGILDFNPKLVQNLLNYIDATPKDLEQIKKDNKSLQKEVHSEVGIETGIKTQYLDLQSRDTMPKAIMIGSTGSDSGKTFITTGLAGALKKRGYKVAVLKVGPDVRDLISAIYLTKEKMEKFSSIKIGHLGWMEIRETLETLKKSDYNFILIEGVMGVFTGLLNEVTPYSAAEIARAANIPIIMVSGSNKGGIETAAVDLASQIKILNQLGVNVPGVIFNKVYNEDIYNNSKRIFEDNENIELITYLPKIKLDKRGGTPEVEIKYDDFTAKAYETIEQNLDVDALIKLATRPKFTGYMDLKNIQDSFKI